MHFISFVLHTPPIQSSLSTVIILGEASVQVTKLLIMQSSPKWENDILEWNTFQMSMLPLSSGWSGSFNSRTDITAARNSTPCYSY
jgi:hypothetical protein